MTYKLFMAIDTSLDKKELMYLLKFYLKKSEAEIYLEFDTPLTINDWTHLRKLIKLREDHMPLSYITQQKEFYGLPFFIDHNCLVPRNDSELMVEFVLQHHSNEEHISLLDLGTGSGCIGLSILKNRPAWQLVCTDICPKALGVAMKNAHLLGLAPQFILSDWFAKIRDTFDIIMTNPPYVSYTDILDLSTLHEPKLSLFTQDHGLYDIKKIISDSIGKVRKYIIIEHGSGHGEQVKLLLQQARYKSIKHLKDLQGYLRTTVGFVDG